MRFEGAVGVVAGRGEQQLPVRRDDQGPFGLAGGARVLGGDAAGLLGEVGETG